MGKGNRRNYRQQFPYQLVKKFYTSFNSHATWKNLVTQLEIAEREAGNRTWSAKYPQRRGKGFDGQLAVCQVKKKRKKASFILSLHLFPRPQDQGTEMYFW